MVSERDPQSELTLSKWACEALPKQGSNKNIEKIKNLRYYPSRKPNSQEIGYRHMCVYYVRDGCLEVFLSLILV